MSPRAIEGFFLFLALLLVGIPLEIPCKCHPISLLYSLSPAPVADAVDLLPVLVDAQPLFLIFGKFPIVDILFGFPF